MATQTATDPGESAFYPDTMLPPHNIRVLPDVKREGTHRWVSNSSSSSCVEGGREGSEWRQEPREGLGNGLEES